MDLGFFILGMAIGYALIKLAEFCVAMARRRR